MDTAPFVKSDWWHRLASVNLKGHCITECGQVIEKPEAQAGSLHAIEQDNGCPLCVPERAMASELAKLGEPEAPEAVPTPIAGPAPKLTAPKITPPEVTPVLGDQVAASDDLDDLNMAALKAIGEPLGLTFKPGTTKAGARTEIRVARIQAAATKAD